VHCIGNDVIVGDLIAGINRYDTMMDRLREYAIILASQVNPLRLVTKSLQKRTRFFAVQCSREETNLKAIKPRHRVAPGSHKPCINGLNMLNAIGCNQLVGLVQYKNVTAVNMYSTLLY
jgi:hypothetical protein